LSACRLPVEILSRILSYLDAATLICLSGVSRLFRRLANDNAVWHKIYTLHFGSQWKPKAAGVAALKAGLRHWKEQYLWTVVGQEMNRCRRELRDLSAHTGLPRQTEQVLRQLNVSWELTVADCFGRRHTFQQSHACFYDASVIVCWSGGRFPSYRHFCSIRLHGVRRVTPRCSGDKRSCWRSLLSELQVKPRPDQVMGKDQLISLVHVSGFLVGVWRGWRGVAFVMTSLHFHRLVERSLLGMPHCPYSELVDRPPPGESGPAVGLHGYALHFVLHGIGTKIVSGRFCQFSRQTVQIRDGLMELTAICSSDLHQHRALSGGIGLPWWAGSLKGSVQNCCFLTVTLLEEFQKPLWCISAPVCLRMAPANPACDYSGEHYLLERRDPEGEVVLRLVWLSEQQQFFLVSLVVAVPVSKVNRHLGTA
uniref:F-box domain-containing protein n=1 Tax=Tetraodon nigroviridis TaxID=99883 RepID=H3C054_TETNG